MGNTTLISGKKDTICWDDHTCTFIITCLYSTKSSAMKNTSPADYVRKYIEEVWILFEIVIIYYISNLCIAC